MTKNETYVIGVDYGTDSVRSVLVDTADGREISSSVFYYPRWKKGLYCIPELNQFRQHPLDYVEGLEATIKGCLQEAGADAAKKVKAISVDMTGSTPVAVDKTGTPLAMTPGMEENPDAMFVLWKDHTSTKEAAEINEHATKFDTNYLKFIGGIYSSEWFWAKLLHVLRHSSEVREACASWVEHCDWVPFLLTGGKDIKEMKRGVCSAGHKALWAADFGGLPPNDFFATLDPLLDGFPDKLFTETFTADEAAGHLSAEWAGRLGLSTDVLIGIGAMDAHMGAVGGQIEPYYLSKVMGTSTCDMLIAPVDEVSDILVRGICGQVPGSVIPGMMGMEAGQSAFGDTYAWFKNLLSWPLRELLPQCETLDAATAAALQQELESKIIRALSDKAEQLPLKDDDVLAIDWLNGRRTPDASQELKGAIMNLSLGTDAPAIYKALVEAICFGARAIVERFGREGVPVKGLIGLGGVARKSPFTMQVLADVINMPIRIHRSEQTCAIGAAMFAATIAGVYEKVEDAMGAMGQGFDLEYHPNLDRIDYYERRYQKYLAFGKYLAQPETSPSLTAVSEL